MKKLYLLCFLFGIGLTLSAQRLEEFSENPSEFMSQLGSFMTSGKQKALEENYASMVVIHGVGIGVLKKEVHKILQKTPFVKTVEQADPGRYGNGATRVVFE